MAVEVQQEQLEPCRVALTISVPPDDIRKAMDSVFNQFAKRTSVPGFRPGKAPRHLLKRFIDEGRVRDLALERALTDAYQDAVRQSGVSPYAHAEPQVELPDEEMDPEKGFSFKATIATEPHVHLGEIDGLSARRVTALVNDDEVQREIDRLREQAATFEATDEPAVEGDRVRLTAVFTLDGEVDEESSFAEPTLLQLGSNLDTFDAGLVGVKSGEEKQFRFTYPADFDDDELRGREAQVDAHIIEVLRRTVPEASDALAARAGFADLAEMKDKLQAMLQAQSDAAAEQDVNHSLVREAVRRSTVHLPDEMVEREVSERVDTLIQNLQRRGYTLDQFLASEKRDLAELQAEFREQATEKLSNTMVLLEVARANSIAVTDRDVEDEVRRRAEAENVKTSQMRRVLSDSGEIGAIRERVFYRKVLALLRDKAEIREVSA